MSSTLLSPYRMPVPFVRWADVVTIPAGGRGADQRRLYDHELVYVLEGEGQVVLDGRAFQTRSDTLFLVQPGVYHSFLSPTETQRLLGVHFDMTPLAEGDEFIDFEFVPDVPNYTRMRSVSSLAGWNLEAQPVLDLKGRPRVRRRLEEVVSEYTRHDGHSRSIAGALLTAAIGQIEREVGLIGEIARHDSAGADAVRRVQRAREWLEHEVENPPSIEEVAHRVGWSGDHLRRMFRAVLDLSPLEIQVGARVRRAQELLRYGQLSRREVALRCGFDDPAYFSRVFKRHTGVSPRQWLADEKKYHL